METYSKNKFSISKLNTLSYLTERSANSAFNNMIPPVPSQSDLLYQLKRPESCAKQVFAKKKCLTARKKIYSRRIGQIKINNIDNDLRGSIYDQIQKAIESWNTRESYLCGKGQIKLTLKIIPNTKEELLRADNLAAKNFDGLDQGKKESLFQNVEDKMQSKLENLKRYLDGFVEEPIGSEVRLLGKRAFSEAEFSR